MIADKALSQALVGKPLSEKDAQRLFSKIFRAQLAEPQIKALLLLQAKRGETSGEVRGCLKALRALEPAIHSNILNLMDTCGTGGDRSHSINISTLAAFVIAGAGGRVAKHGNRGITSRCGSSDLMEALGVKLDAGPKRMLKALKKYGIGYFHAPFYHPIFSRVQPIRRRIKARTVFNLLGPLVNPLGVRRQIVGVSKREHLELYAEILKKSRMDHAVICHSHDGMDEISTAGKTSLIWVRKGQLKRQVLDFRSYRLQGARKGDFQGGNATRNQGIARRLLKGKLRGKMRDIIALNAAVGLMVGGRAKTVAEGLKSAKRSIDSGAAYRSLQGLVNISRGRE